MGVATKERWQQLRASLAELRGTPGDEEIVADVELDDPEQERFVEQLDAIKLTLGRCALVGIPTWILALAIYPLLLPGGAPVLGLGLASLVASGACVGFEVWWRRGRPRRRRRADSTSRRRLDPRTRALIAIVVGGLLVAYVIFVLAVSR